MWKDKAYEEEIVFKTPCRNKTKNRQKVGFCLLISQKVKSSCQAHPAVVLSGLGLT